MAMGRMTGALRALMLAALAAAAYFAAARIGYALTIPQGVATFWPASGVMLGLLSLRPRGEWPALVAGAMLASIVSDSINAFPPGAAVFAAVANAVEWTLAAWLLTRRLGRPPWLGSVASVVTFVVGISIVVNAATAMLGAAMLHAQFPNASIAHQWFAWWVGDGLGMLIVAPLFLTWPSMRRWWSQRTAGAVVEAASALVVLLLVSFVGLGRTPSWAVDPREYLVFPVVFWIAIRFGLPGAAVVSVVVAFTSTIFSANGLGPFVRADVIGSSTAMGTYTFLATVGFSALLTAAVIDDRRLVSSRLHASESRYRAVVDGVRDAIVSVDAEHRIRFANRATARIFGRSDASLIGAALQELVPSTRVLSRQPTPSQDPELLPAGVREVAGRHSDGSDIPLEASFGELVIEGRPEMTMVLRDLRESREAARALRHAEDRMRVAIEALRAAVWEVDLRAGSISWSTSGAGFHSLTAGAFHGTLDEFLVSVDPSDHESLRAAVRRLTVAAPELNVTWRLVADAQRGRWINAVGRATFSPDGRAIGLMGIAIDVSAQHDLQEQLRQAQKMEAVGQLAGGVAHDFNNLLTAIQGYTSLIADALPSDNPVQADLAEIDKATTRAASLTRQLLAFSRRQQLSPTVLRLADSVRGMQSLLTRLIGSGIRVTVVADPDAGQVLADATGIEQVVLNLALNARDAMHGAGQLRLEVDNVDVDDTASLRSPDASPGSYVRLRVSDTGHGMDATTMARVFEPFFTTKPAGVGTGLGLATVHGVVTQSGGFLHVRSEPGAGTTFEVYLPRAEATSGAAG